MELHPTVTSLYSAPHYPYYPFTKQDRPELYHRLTTQVRTVTSLDPLSPLRYVTVLPRTFTSQVSTILSPYFMEHQHNVTGRFLTNISRDLTLRNYYRPLPDNPLQLPDRTL